MTPHSQILHSIRLLVINLCVYLFITASNNKLFMYLQVNLCQKLLFLHQLTHNMTTDCSLNYKFNTLKFQAQTWGEHVVYRNRFWHSEQFLYTTSPCSAKRRASDKDLPVSECFFLSNILSGNAYLDLTIGKHNLSCGSFFWVCAIFKIKKLSVAKFKSGFEYQILKKVLA